MNIEGTTATAVPRPETRGQLARMLVERPDRPDRPAPEPAAQPRESGASGLKQAVEKANEAARRRSIDLRFGIHEGTGEFYVTVLDPKTDEILKTVPPEELLDFRARLEQSIGILFDRTA